MPETYMTDLQVAARYNVHRATPWRWAKTNSKFPKPVVLSSGCTRWKLSDLEVWENEKKLAHA